MTNVEKAQHIYDMLGEGKLLDAFDKYYHDDVVMQEVGEAARTGKEACREYEKNFLGMMKDFHGMGVTAVTADAKGDTTMVESWMDVSFQNDQRVKMEQVAVQRWKDGQIIHETFFHK